MNGHCIFRHVSIRFMSSYLNTTFLYFSNVYPDSNERLKVTLVTSRCKRFMNQLESIGEASNRSFLDIECKFIGVIFKRFFPVRIAIDYQRQNEFRMQQTCCDYVVIIIISTACYLFDRNGERIVHLKCIRTYTVSLGAVFAVMPRANAALSAKYTPFSMRLSFLFFFLFREPLHS